ncbi:V-type ATP synthase subunit D [Photobacterium sp. SDRW27]|uniref:V-type ATP synthase subunit D n=1 Tax=Photobacterium obscurum TaxID=2829490 RepID=UPI0022443396|nr:V-type ATP synthase subunit D [Photobacterium obscurum]MCW8331553.1 V-type ATP synthase subunit D [Photobacterium obscurum]
MPLTVHRPATKAELVSIKTELKIAREGLDLLERKRDMLMAEGLKQLRQAKTLRQQVTQAWAVIQNHWQDTLEHESFQTLKRLADAVEQPAPLQDNSHRWMSVELAELSLAKPAPKLLGSITQVGIRPEQVRGKLGELMPELAKLMTLETNIRRIAAALKQTHRQVNALNQVIIPELTREKNRIEQQLEEKEREAIFQIKRLKARLL